MSIQDRIHYPVHMNDPLGEAVDPSNKVITCRGHVVLGTVAMDLVPIWASNMCSVCSQQ